VKVRRIKWEKHNALGKSSPVPKMNMKKRDAFIEVVSSSPPCTQEEPEERRRLHEPIIEIDSDSELDISEKTPFFSQDIFTPSKNNLKNKTLINTLPSTSHSQLSGSTHCSDDLHIQSPPTSSTSTLIQKPKKTKNNKIPKITKISKITRKTDKDYSPIKPLKLLNSTNLKILNNNTDKNTINTNTNIQNKPKPTQKLEKLEKPIKRGWANYTNLFTESSHQPSETDTSSRNTIISNNSSNTTNTFPPLNLESKTTVVDSWKDSVFNNTASSYYSNTSQSYYSSTTVPRSALLCELLNNKKMLKLKKAQTLSQNSQNLGNNKKRRVFSQITNLNPSRDAQIGGVRPGTKAIKSDRFKGVYQGTCRLFNQETRKHELFPEYLDKDVGFSSLLQSLIKDTVIYLTI
jgi:hypothetical protein